MDFHETMYNPDPSPWYIFSTLLDLGDGMVFHSLGVLYKVFRYFPAATPPALHWCYMRLL